LVEEHDVETVGLALAKLSQKDAEAGGIEARQLPPEGVPRSRLHRGIEPVILIPGLDHLDGLHALACQSTANGQVEPQPAFILAEEPYGLLRLLPA
jgi:hypothetical protein